MAQANQGSGSYLGDLGAGSMLASLSLNESSSLMTSLGSNCDCNDFILSNQQAYSDAVSLFQGNQAYQSLTGATGYEFGSWALFAGSGKYAGLDQNWTIGPKETSPNGDIVPNGAGAMEHTHSVNPMPSPHDRGASVYYNMPIYVLSPSGITVFNPWTKTTTTVAGAGWWEGNPCKK